MRSFFGIRCYFCYCYCYAITIHVSVVLHQLLQEGTSYAAAQSEEEIIIFTRYSRDAYHRLRGDVQDPEPYNSSSKDRIKRKLYNGSSDVNVNVNGKDNNKQQTSSTYDDRCTIYLATSSIPNSGLGMYSSVPYHEGEVIPIPEIGIVVQDIVSDFHKNLLSNYNWNLQALTFAEHEVESREGQCTLPGFGMAVNSHLGLINVQHYGNSGAGSAKMKLGMDGTDSYLHTESLTMEDTGRGASSSHGRIMFEAAAPIEAGEELFIAYGEGDEWFRAREYLMPGKEHFQEAQDLLEDFSKRYLQGQNQREGKIERQNEWQMLLKRAKEKDKRLRAALPDHLSDVPAALEVGTARFSMPDSIRSEEWLEENGCCMDNILSGVSTIPQAGRGAFSTRSIKKGEQIISTPVVILERSHLHLEKETGHQLLLNYCYGHRDSSLLFFPYAPSVNFINHGSLEDSNAEIVWSAQPYHRAEWLNDSLGELKGEKYAGLMFDVIARRDLQRGEEILLYYGKDWEESWNQHVEEWACSTNNNDHKEDGTCKLHHRLGRPTPLDLNILEENPIVRTREEQMENPYPKYITTLCQFQPPETCTPPADHERTPWHCQSRWTKIPFDTKQFHPCTILSRESIGGSDDWYTAQITAALKGKRDLMAHLVTYLPRSSIAFFDKKYSKDQYAPGVFRQNIGLPDGFLPSHWMDLERDATKIANELA